MAEQNGGLGLVDKVKQGAVSQLNTQKNRAIDGITSVVDAMRQGSSELREEHGTIASYVDDAVSHVDSFANRIKQKDARELWDDAQRFARGNPAVFVGSAFAIGLLAARFFKSSRQNNTPNSWNAAPSSGGTQRRSHGLATAAMPVGSTGYSGSGSVASTGTAAQEDTGPRRAAKTSGSTGRSTRTSRDSSSERS